MKTENESLFYDVRNDLSPNINLLIVIGGWGIGKTYSALRLLHEQEKMMYIRNQATDLDLSIDPEGNPFKRLNKDLGWNVWLERHNKICQILESNPQEPEADPVVRGVAIALTTSRNLKGFDMSDYTLAVYDEFIPDQGVTLRVNEGNAFVRFYETVARNREILGEEPFKCILLSNATQIASNVLIALGLEDIVERMVRNGQKKVTIPQKGIRIVMPQMEKLKELKSQTAIYKAIGSKSKIAQHALNNHFTDMSLQYVAKRKLSEYIGRDCYEGMYVYKHKSRNEFYISRSHCDVEQYTKTDSFILFKQKYWFLRDRMVDGTFIYESYQIKRQWYEVFGI